ncbi:PXA domain-containing protein [Xylaria sp. FL1777]|nr:PXA domain-containing protein [Xylaria sp. FL1777]
MTDVGRRLSGGSSAQSESRSPVDANPSTASSEHAHTEPPSSPTSQTDLAKGSGRPSAGQDDDIATKIFQFLSTATPASFGAIAAALAAVTYFILGRVGLLLIGAFAGVSLFVIWESQHPEVARAVRGEKGHAFLDRLLNNTYGDLGLQRQQDEEKDSMAIAQSFDDFQPETRDALYELVDAVIRDYVDWWYGPIIPSDKSFPLACRRVFTQFVISFSNRLRRKRPADAFVDFVTHSCSIVIVFFSEMAAAYAELPTDSHMTAADAIYNYLATHTEAPLSNLLNQRQQGAKFKMVAEDLLDFLEKSTYDCDPARVFLREVLSTVILEGTLQTCSKAEWINGWIVYLLESGETDLSQAIDEAIQDQKAFGDVDGNVGNIGLSKGNRNSYELDRQRRKDMVHKKKLSKADEEMEKATEEMKRLNEMIAEAGSTKPALQLTTSETSNVQNIHKGTNERELNINTSSKDIPVKTLGPSTTGSELAPDSLQIDKTNTSQYTSTSPISPKSPTDSSNQIAPPVYNQEPSSAQGFTSFDQLVPPAKEEEDDDGKASGPPPLTIYNASITIHDDATADNSRLRNKPTWEYLLQIEPSSSHYSGWMIMKTYTQFEGLHESLRRLANISGATAFLEAHSVFPSWRLHTRSSLRGELERYMRNACGEKSLAESEAMKRFLDKGQDPKMGINRGFSFESVGKGMLDVIQNAPKGALDGGKVVMGGVTGVFGNIGLGPKKSTNASVQQIQTMQGSGSRSPSSTRPVSLPVLPRMDTAPAINGSKMSRDSLDSQRSSIVSVQPSKIPPMDRRPSSQADLDLDSTLHPTRADRWEQKSSVSAASSRGHSRASSAAAAARSPLRSPSEISLSNLKLPPPPNEITDDYGSPTSTRLSMDGNSRFSNSFASPIRTSLEQQGRSLQTNGALRRPVKHFPPLSEQETRVAIELLFAVITELYTLSSAWNIRRTLLTAAKSFLLRPGNPSLVSIQSLIQSSLLDANTSDDGLAIHIRKLRENSLPTEEERKAWPADLTATEKEELREKARKLFIQSSVPAALMGIMGQSATNEALGRVFDCLQIEEVARGLFFGLILQAVRVVTH